ncbi:hypothetical protein ACFTWD_09355 [Streptomyces sp. NPDC056943]|uniref:hypothetical protein n=1 Tax=Streptomyces sp. NPDC056943 TaxID=3345971 RepID=UPI003643DEA7
MTQPSPFQAARETLRVSVGDTTVAIPVTAAEAIADWLGCLSVLDPAEYGGQICAWCSSDHADTITRKLLDGRR